MSRRPRLFASLAQWAAIVLCVGLGLVLFFFVDLTPRVEADFFFSRSDPQSQKSARIEQEFAGAPQVFVAARSRELVSSQYLSRLRELTEALQNVKGVADARSITHGPEDPKKIAEREPGNCFKKSRKVRSGVASCSGRIARPRLLFCG